MLYTEKSDQELIQEYINGDEKALEALLNLYKEKIYTSIYIRLKDHFLADDIFQETFIKIINTLKEGKYNHEGKFLPWAMRIAYNLMMDHFRKNQFGTRFPLGQDMEEGSKSNQLEKSLGAAIIKPKPYGN